MKWFAEKKYFRSLKNTTPELLSCLRFPRALLPPPLIICVGAGADILRGRNPLRDALFPRATSWGPFTCSSRVDDRALTLRFHAEQRRGARREEVRMRRRHTAEGDDAYSALGKILIVLVPAYLPT